MIPDGFLVEVSATNGRPTRALQVTRQRDGMVFQDTINTRSAEARERSIRRAVRKFAEPAESLTWLDDALMTKSDEADLASLADAKQQTAEVTGADGRDLLSKMPEHVRREARAMLESPNLMQQILDDVGRCGVAGERELTAALYIVGVSRVLPKPLAAIVSAPSSVGKSYTVGKVADMFPPEAVIHATSLTPQALFYMEPGSLCHRWVVAGERSRKDDDDIAESTRALREMISAGKLTKLIPMKIEGRMVTQSINQEGPIAFVESTTMTNIFAEDANRCLLLAADERPEQTTAIINRLAAEYVRPNDASIAHIIEKHHAAHRMLRQMPVIVPFSETVAEHFPTDRVEARRAFPHLMSAIQASAILHQYQRKEDGAGRLIASDDDYQLARHLCLGPLARTLGGGISGAALRFFDRICEWNPDRFTTQEAYRRDRKSPQNVRAWLRELSDAGAVEQLEQARGSKSAIWRLTGVDRAELQIGDCGLPTSMAG